MGLKRNILEKILDPAHREATRHLRRLMTIRNHFAHRSRTVFSQDHPAGYAPDPKKPEEALDYDALVAEFDVLCPKIEKALIAAFRSKGGATSESPWPAA